MRRRIKSTLTNRPRPQAKALKEKKAQSMATHKEAIKAMLREGHSLREIGRALSLSFSTVRNYIHEIPALLQIYRRKNARKRPSQPLQRTQSTRGYYGIPWDVPSTRQPHNGK